MGSVCAEIDAEGTEREETWGGVSPDHPTRGLGSVVISPAWSGAEPRPKMDLCILEARKKPFQYF